RVELAEGDTTGIVAGERVEWAADRRPQPLDARTDDELCDSARQRRDGTGGRATPRSRSTDEVEDDDHGADDDPGVKDDWKHSAHERASECTRRQNLEGGGCD